MDSAEAPAPKTVQTPDETIDRLLEALTAGGEAQAEEMIQSISTDTLCDVANNLRGRMLIVPLQEATEVFLHLFDNLSNLKEAGEALIRIHEKRIKLKQMFDIIFHICNRRASKPLETPTV